MRQTCTQCPSNSIAINDGFIIDAKMDDETNLAGKIAKHFDIGCAILHINSDNSDETSLGVLDYNCNTWGPTG